MYRWTVGLPELVDTRQLELILYRDVVSTVVGGKAVTCVVVTVVPTKPRLVDSMAEDRRSPARRGPLQDSQPVCSSVVALVSIAVQGYETKNDHCLIRMWQFAWTSAAWRKRRRLRCPGWLGHHRGAAESHVPHPWVRYCVDCGIQTLLLSEEQKLCFCRIHAGVAAASIPKFLQEYAVSS